GSLEFLNSLSDEEVLSVFQGISQFTLEKSIITNSVDILSLLAENTNIFPSKGEARKMIQNGGVSLNKEKIAAVDLAVDSSNLINDKFLVVQKGKKNYFLIIAE